MQAPRSPATGGGRRRLGLAALAAVLALATAGGAALMRALPEVWSGGGALSDAGAAATAAAAIPPGAYEVCFTPGGECTDLILRELRRARRQVLVQAYGFTSPEIAQALREARRRRVEVRAILDRSAVDDRYSVATYLVNAGIPVLVDDPPGLAHSKVMVIDGATVITGSFNFTRSAQERNAENLLVLRDRRLAAAYAENWERRRAASEPYDPALHAPDAEDDRRPRRRGAGERG